MFLLAGIAAANYSHVKYFPSRGAYDVFIGNHAARGKDCLQGICCVCPGVGGTLPAHSQRRSRQLVREFGGLVRVVDTVYVMQCTAGQITTGG
jgi:hypothetical protein